MIEILTDEDKRQYAMLISLPGRPHSGRMRYAAAMHFYMRGMIGGETLEIYRTCANLDCEDPRSLLETRGLAGEIEMESTDAISESLRPAGRQHL